MSHISTSKRYRLDVGADDIAISNWDDVCDPISYVEHQPSEILLPLQL